jgi:hypothetical protein
MTPRRWRIIYKGVNMGLSMVVIGVMSGVVDEATVFFDEKLARKYEAKLKRAYDIRKGYEGESENTVECFEMDIEGIKVDDCLRLARTIAVDRADYAVDVWSIGDVLDRAKEQGKRVSKKQAREIIQQVYLKKDATIGISWDTLDYWTYVILNEAKGKGVKYA